MSRWRPTLRAACLRHREATGVGGWQAEPPQSLLHPCSHAPAGLPASATGCTMQAPPRIPARPPACPPARPPPRGLFAANRKRRRGMPVLGVPQEGGRPPLKLLPCTYSSCRSDMACGAPLQAGREGARAPRQAQGGGVRRTSACSGCKHGPAPATCGGPSQGQLTAYQMSGSVPLMSFPSRLSTVSWGKAPGVPHCRRVGGCAGARQGQLGAVEQVTGQQAAGWTAQQGSRPTAPLWSHAPRARACSGSVPVSELDDRRRTLSWRMLVSSAPHCCGSVPLLLVGRGGSGGLVCAAAQGGSSGSRWHPTRPLPAQRLLTVGCCRRAAVAARAARPAHPTPAARDGWVGLG